MTFRLTVVVDNKATDGLVAEHGYALHLETPTGNILLDSGQKEALLPNMERLDIDPKKISILVVSHGHYDHTGGVTDLLRCNKELEIYLHSESLLTRYCLEEKPPARINMQAAAKESITNHPEERLHWLNNPIDLSDAIGITGTIPRINDFEDTGGKFYLDPEGREIDTIVDDMAMWLRSPDGLIVCVGCCHSGLVNTLTHIIAQAGEKRIALVIGGLHLLNSSDERLTKTVEALRNFDISRLIACHCSGESTANFLNSHLDAEVSSGYAGLVIEV